MLTRRFTFARVSVSDIEKAIGGRIISAKFSDWNYYVCSGFWKLNEEYITVGRAFCDKKIGNKLFGFSAIVYGWLSGYGGQMNEDILSYLSISYDMKVFIYFPLFNEVKA